MKSGYVYLFEMDGRYNDHQGPIKIGHSKKPARRAREQTACPGDIWVLHTILTNDMGWLEKLLHQDFANQRIRENGEWFALDDDAKTILQDIRVLDCIPLGALYGLPGHSIPEGYFSPEPGEEAFAGRSQAELEELLTEAGWKLERQEVHISWEKLRDASLSLCQEVLDILQGRDLPALVMAKCGRNVICTAAWRYSDSLRKVAARVQKVGLL